MLRCSRPKLSTLVIVAILPGNLINPTAVNLDLWLTSYIPFRHSRFYKLTISQISFYLRTPQRN